MTRDATESSATMAEAPNPEKYRSLIAALRNRLHDTYGLTPSRYFRWISGEMPDVIRFVIEHREIAAALHEDAIRYELEGERSPIPPDSKK